MKVYSDNTDHGSISAQVQNAFVDDLYFSDPTGRPHFFQRRNVGTLTWHTGSPHSLEYDFSKQKEGSEESNISFSLVLVYSKLGSTLKPIPSSISNGAEVFYLPHYEDLNRLILEGSEFKNTLANISMYQNTKPDQLRSLAIILMGVRNSMGKQNVL